MTDTQSEDRREFDPAEWLRNHYQDYLSIVGICDGLEAAWQAARSRQQQDAVDAARYRWLRDPKNETHPAWDELIETGQKAETFDATVDAALEGDKL